MSINSALVNYWEGLEKNWHLYWHFASSGRVNRVKMRRNKMNVFWCFVFWITELLAAECDSCLRVAFAREIILTLFDKVFALRLTFVSSGHRIL